jgi:uncharacterized membrane protein
MTSERIVLLSQKAYALSIIALGIQQLRYGEISDNYFPTAFAGGTIYQVIAYLWGIAFTLSGVAMLIDKRAYEVALISGGIFLTLFFVAELPYMLFVSEHTGSLLYWASAVETLAFTGTSFVFAASCRSGPVHSSAIIRSLEKLIPLAGAFFSAMLIVYGIDHFVYTEFVSAMVPSWIPGHYFWTYLAGVALICAGIAITFKIKLKLAASLMGLMFFLWFVILHIPRAIDNPSGGKGLELTRVFAIFGYVGIALLFALTGSKSRA